MKFNRQLLIANQSKHIVSERIMLHSSMPGQAWFTVAKDDQALATRQIVQFDFGYSHQNALRRWFIGYIEKMVPEPDQRIRLVCRELSTVLATPLSLNLRHVSMRDVLKEISRITALSFSIPEADYADRQVANFYNIGTGYQAMDLIGRVFNVPDYIWQQQGNGVVFAGSWAQSRWSELGDVVVQDSLFDRHSANESARIAAIPQLRPGVILNGHRLSRIEFQGNHMVVSWNS